MQLAPSDLAKAAYVEYPNVDDNFDRATGLHQAAYHGNMNVLRYLLIERKAKVSLIDNSGYAPLHFACMGGHVDAADLLLAHGADISIIDDVGFNALHTASMEGYVDVVRLLIRYGARVHELTRNPPIGDQILAGTDDEQNTALALAVEDGHLEVVGVLEEAIIDLQKLTAFAMAHHLRLGEKSIAKALDPEVLRIILTNVQ